MAEPHLLGTVSVGMQSVFLHWPFSYIIIADEYETPNVLENNGLSGHVF